MNYGDLAAEEQEIVNRLRTLKDAQKKAVLASQNSFIEWLKTSVSSVWNKVSGYASDLWQWFTGLF